MADTKKTWVTVLIVLFLLAGLSMIALVGGAAYWISRHVATEVTSRRPNERATPRGDIAILHARVYDPAVGKMVRADIPFWLIRAGKSLPFLADMGSLTLEDLEQHGPGLIVNGHGDNASRFSSGLSNPTLYWRAIVTMAP